MRKGLFYSILPVILMGIVILLFVSCTTMFLPETGIVTITVEIESTVLINAGLERQVESYYIYMDDVYKGIITGSGVLTLQNVSKGIYTFVVTNYLMAGISADRNETFDSQEDSLDRLNGITCYGSIVSEVKPGIVNYVTIPVSCGYIEAME